MIELGTGSTTNTGGLPDDDQGWDKLLSIRTHQDHDSEKAGGIIPHDPDDEGVPSDLQTVRGATALDIKEAGMAKELYETLVRSIFRDMPTAVLDALVSRTEMGQLSIRPDGKPIMQDKNSTDELRSMLTKAGEGQIKLAEVNPESSALKFYLQNLQRINDSFELAKKSQDGQKPVDVVDVMIRMVKDAGIATDLMVQALEAKALDPANINKVWADLVDAREVLKAVRKNIPSLITQKKQADRTVAAPRPNNPPILPPPPGSPGEAYKF